MFSKDSLLNRSFGILNSNLAFVILAGFLELRLFALLIPFVPWETTWGKLFLVVLAIARIYFYSGMYGALLGLASGEEVTHPWGKFHANAKRLWKIYAPIALLPGVLHFVLFIFLPRQEISLASIKWCGDIFFSGLVVLFFVSSKYLKSLGISPRPIGLKGREILLLLSFGALGVAMAILPRVVDLASLRLDRIFVWFGIYVHVLIFLFLAHLVLARYPEVRQHFVSEPELYLINPVEGGTFLNWVTLLTMRVHPYWLSIISALTPARYRIRIFNRMPWHKRYVVPGKLVAISCPAASNSPEAYKIAKEFKRIGSTVIMGGLHAGAFPDEALEFCDTVVVGEVEGVWPQVIEDYENHRLQRKYFPRQDEENYRKVHQFLRNSPPYVIKASIETTRHCKYNCYFCCLQRQGASPRRKPVQEVVELVQKMKQRYREIVFLDNNIYSDPEYVKELFQALKPLNVRWVAASTFDLCENEAILSLAKESGCKLLFLGYEIVPGSGEEAQGGKLAMSERYLELTEKIKSQGIAIRSNFIIGYDFHTLAVFWDLFRFCFRLRTQLLGLFILTPLPGSQFFKDALSQDRITTLNWRNYNCATLVFKPQHIPPVFLSRPIFFPYVIILVLFTTKIGAIAGFSLVCLWIYYVLG